MTIQEREREEKRAQQIEKEAQRSAEERRRQTLRMVEDEVSIFTWDCDLYMGSPVHESEMDVTFCSREAGLFVQKGI